uniref:Uncharacterized protein n=1 Tax=Pseudo-nitzschia australis TaxID=44445 RepID=A0A6U9WN18_9STRA
MSSIFDPLLMSGLGSAAAVFLSALGGAAASTHGAVFAMKSKMPLPLSLVPIVQAGVLAIYGPIISYLIIGRMSESMTTGEGFRYLAAGLTVGLACLASGWGMSGFLEQLNKGLLLPSPPIPPKSVEKEGATIFTPILPKEGDIDVSTRASFRMTVLSLIFLEAIGLYGLIVALILVA